MARKFSELPDDERKDYEFAYRQLDIIDSKANNVLMVDAVLIVISTLSILFSKNAFLLERIVGTIATSCVLVSLFLCLRTMKIEWSDTFSVDRLRDVRDIRTKSLGHSLSMLFTALVLFVVMFVIDIAQVTFGH